MRVTNGIPLGRPLFLLVHTVNCVQTLKAHAVIVLQLSQVKRGGQRIQSQLCLADLGGSEQLKRSKAEGTVRVFRQKFTLEDAIGSHACLLEANTRVTNGIPLGSSLRLPVCTVNCVQTLKGSSLMKP
jgi:hypothetical protein